MTQPNNSILNPHNQNKNPLPPPLPTPFMQNMAKLSSGVLYFLRDVGAYTTGVIIETVHANTSKYPALQKTVDFVTPYLKTTHNATCALATLYNFWCAKLVFCISTALGTLFSVPGLPSRYFGVLQNSLYGKTPEEHSQFKTAMIVVAVVNYLLNRTFLDDKVFGMITGLMFGNFLFHTPTEFGKQAIENLTKTLKFPDFFGKLASNAAPMLSNALNDVNSNDNPINQNESTANRPNQGNNNGTSSVEGS